MWKTVTKLKLPAGQGAACNMNLTNKNFIAALRPHTGMDSDPDCGVGKLGGIYTGTAGALRACAAETAAIGKNLLGGLAMAT
jgi:hypothetical protein